MASWYYVDRGERAGPVEQAELAELIRSGALPAETLVWAEGMADWRSAREIPALLDFTAPDVEHPIAALPANEARAQAWDPEPVEALSVITYAGFWKRFVAWFLDYLITAILGFAFGCVFGLVLGVVAMASGVDPESQAYNALLQSVGVLVGTIIGWLYFALFESSSRQATPGKMALGIQVTDLSGHRLTFARATGRHFGKFLSVLTLGLGFVMAGVTEKKQALHDLIAGTLVVDR